MLMTQPAGELFKDDQLPPPWHNAEIRVAEGVRVDLVTAQTGSVHQMLRPDRSPGLCPAGNGGRPPGRRR